jgi:hypothetical protein
VTRSTCPFHVWKKKLNKRINKRRRTVFGHVFFIAFVEQSVSIFSRVKVPHFREFRRTGGSRVDRIKCGIHAGKLSLLLTTSSPPTIGRRSMAEQGRERDEGKDEEAKIR